ncbi:hypothetical protein M0F05_13010, partial [Ralstonia solanacearum]|nr:hypothetical protein [Ralstonia solanacearum]
AKAAILSQVGQVYFGGWVSFTSALTDGDPLLEFLSQGGEGENSLRSDSSPSFFLPATEIQGAI